MNLGTISSGIISNLEFRIAVIWNFDDFTNIFQKNYFKIGICSLYTHITVTPDTRKFLSFFEVFQIKGLTRPNLPAFLIVIIHYLWSYNCTSTSTTSPCCVRTLVLCLQKALTKETPL